MIDIVNGQERVRSWPKSRGRSISPITKKQNDLFREAQTATKYWAPLIQQRMAESVAGSPLLPRDIMTMIMYGRFAFFDTTDGRRYYPMTAQKDISDSLDIIAPEPGYMLYRYPDGWRGIPALAGAMEAKQLSASFERKAVQNIPANISTRIKFDTPRFTKVDMMDLPNSRLVVPVGANRARAILNLGSSQGAVPGRTHIEIYKTSGANVLRAAITSTNENIALQLNMSTPVIEVKPGDFFDAYILPASATSIGGRTVDGLNPVMSLECWSE